MTGHDADLAGSPGPGDRPRLDPSEAVATALAGYAFPNLLCWQRTGQIFALCRDQGRGFTPTPTDRETLATDRGERRQLADESIARTVERWRRTDGGGWDPARGRSMRSYFLIGCVREYPTVFRRWSTDRHLEDKTQNYGLGPPDWTRGAVPDHADTVVEELSGLTDILDTLDPGIREIAVLLADGLTHDEIGDRLGLTARAVEGRIHRFRIRHRRST